MIKLGYNEDVPNELLNDKRFSLCYELSFELVDYFKNEHKIDVWNFNRYNKVLDRIYPNKKFWTNVKIETLLVFIKIINSLYDDSLFHNHFDKKR